MTTMLPPSPRHPGLTARHIAAVLTLAGGLALAIPATARQAQPPAPAAEATADHGPAAHAATTPEADAAHGTADAHAADTHAADGHGADAGHGEAHGESIWVTLSRLANFAILAGVIYLIARKPLASHLESRGTRIRKDLVEAAAMKQTAAERLTEIETRLAALPGELEQMRTRSAEELDAERTRMRAAAEVERDRLVEQARREIATQTRTARAQLSAHAAALAVDVAEARLRATLTPVEQAALVDQYASQMRTIQ